MIKDIGSEHEEINIKYNVLMPNSIYLENFIEHLNSLYGVKVSHKYLEGDSQELQISGKASSEDMADVARANIPSLADLGVDYPEWPNDSLGILIILLTFFIFEDADYGKE